MKKRFLVLALASLIDCATALAQVAEPQPPTPAAPTPAIPSTTKPAPPPAKSTPPTAVKPGPANAVVPPPDAALAPPLPILRFCAVPVRPECIDAAATYANPQSRGACNLDMDHYVKSVFAYRRCLNAEMERAVLQTNEAIFRHKCRMAGKKNCP
jgi:hypothetical protein